MLKIRIHNNNNNCPRDSLGSDDTHGVVGRKGACFLDPSCLRSRLHAFSRRSSRIWRKFRDLLKKREKNKKKNKWNLAIFPRTTMIVRDSFFFLCGKFWKKIFARDPRFRSRILRDNSRSRGTIDEELQKKKKRKRIKKETRQAEEAADGKIHTFPRTTEENRYSTLRPFANQYLRGTENCPLSGG